MHIFNIFMLIQCHLLYVSYCGDLTIRYAQKSTGTHTNIIMSDKQTYC